jgi:arylsulfatase A-like enzyme
MNRHRPLPAALAAMLALAAVLVSAPSPASAAAARPPSVVFVIADQWRAQAFGYAGDPNAKTPNLDRFETQCVNFAQAVAGTPVCSVTRASLLTGQRPLTHGVFLNDVPLDPTAVTLPKELRAAGYDTACVGKWHIDGHGRSAYIPPERRQGFDYWKVLECTHAYNNSPYYAGGPEKLKWDGYDAIAQTRDVQTYLKSRGKEDKPFLMWLAWGPPHNPYETAPPKYKAMYAAETIALPPNVPESAKAQARKELAGYYAHCAALDDCFGDLLKTLAETRRADGTSLADDTIVVFTSDHGDMLWSHDQQRKQRPWEESVRVPMLFRVPAGVAAAGAAAIKPHRTAAAINTEDVMPTLLSLCGRPVPKSIEGLDFDGAMRGGPDPSGGATVARCVSPFGEYARRRGGREYRAVRTAKHSYVRGLDGPWLLYDNAADPSQLNNLVGQPAHAALQADMEALLTAKLAAQHDDFRPGPEYVKKWGYKVDADETVRYTP